MGYKLSLYQPHRAVMKKADMLAGIRYTEMYSVRLVKLTPLGLGKVSAEVLCPVLVTAF